MAVAAGCRSRDLGRAGRRRPARSLRRPGWNITPASVANHIALAGMCSAKSNRLCSIIGSMPSAGAELQQREAAARPRRAAARCIRVD